MLRHRYSVFGESKANYESSNFVFGEYKRETTSNDAMTEIGTENPNPVVGERNEVPETEKLMNGESSRNIDIDNDNDTPPTDDCCPICFDDFTIACKTNCGHWFCASCILQFWNYMAALQKCKCPICSRLISKLTPEASLLILQEEEVMEILKNIQRYNRLFQGGAQGLLRKVIELPLVFKRMFRGLMDPDRLRINYYTLRFAALFLSCIYTISPFDFIPTGGLGARRLFDICAVSVVVVLYFVGIGHRLLLRRRVRLLDAAQP